MELRAIEVLSAESVLALRFEPRTSDSKVKMIHYTNGSDLKVQKNHLHHYIPPPFEERRLVWGDSI